MPPLFDHRRQKLAEQRRYIELVELFADCALGNAAKAFVVQCGDNIAHQPRRAHPHPAFAARRRAQEFTHCACDIHALNAARDDLGGQEIGAQEAGECAPEPFLIIGNDCCVRDRDTQRMPEQRSHREPVGKPADHARLGKSAQKAPMAFVTRFHIIAADKQQHHEAQQAGCDNPHLPQFGITRGVAGFFRLPQFVGRVLVADDNPVNIKVAAAFLRKIGLHSDATANGIETLVALDTAPYDLVLMDCQMPEMDGFTATTELRRRETSDGKVRIPVIALTANAMAGDREVCLQAGMDGYLTKPIRIESLIEAVRPYLALKSEAASQPLPESEVSEQSLTTTHERQPKLDPHLMPDFDPESIHQLLADLDDPDGLILPELETGFLEQSEKQIAELLSSTAIDDLPKIALIAHALKGQNLTLGLMTMADAMIRLEQHAQSGDAAACQHLAALVPALYERACAALAQRIHG